MSKAIGKKLLGVALIAAMSIVLGAPSLTGTTVEAWDDHPVHDYYYLLFADLVVQGSVTEVSSELVPIRDTQPHLGPEFEDHYVKALVVKLTVEDVLKGFEKPTSVTFSVVAPTEAPMLKQVGLKIVVGLRKVSRSLAEFRMKSREGLYAFDGDVWVSQGSVKGGRKHTIEELRTKLDSVSVPSLSREADAVFIGTVEQVEESKHWGATVKEYGLIRKITLRVDKTLVGDVPAAVTVSSVAAGSYWPDWRFRMPDAIEAGKRTTRSSSRQTEFSMS